MSDPLAGRMPGPPRAAPAYGSQGSSANLADILERVLDKGIVIAGDIQINLLDIELLTIKLRLLVASVDKAKEMGIDWWEHDPSLSSRARPARSVPVAATAEGGSLAEENERLRAELAQLRSAAGMPGPSTGTAQTQAARQASGREEEETR
ncbi:gas vesicle protein [Streptomyces exfoliatus]|uniref:gas vesicle protein n=1 Tax=Streptomyces exfoliatus TaxID=1905 RepID=UPI003F4CE0F9